MCTSNNGLLLVEKEVKKVAGDQVAATLSLAMHSFRIKIPVLIFNFCFHENIDCHEKYKIPTHFESLV